MFFLWWRTSSTMKKQLTLSLIFAFFLSLAATAEIAWKSGYVILNSGDTIKGEIKINTKKEIGLYSKVQMKQGESSKSYKPEQVKEYIVGESRFLSRKFEGEMVFMKVVTSGRILIFEWQFEMQRGNELVVDSEYYIQINDGSNSEPQKLKPAKFKKLAAELMNDHSELVEKIQNDNKKFELGDVQAYVEE